MYMYVCMYAYVVCMYVRTYMYVCMYVCMYVRMYMYVHCMYVYVYTYVCSKDVGEFIKKTVHFSPENRIYI